MYAFLFYIHRRGVGRIRQPDLASRYNGRAGLDQVVEVVDLLYIYIYNYFTPKHHT
jgi:hypothetical protein